ncbi:MAG: biopolymer transporter ExbD [Pseudomonadota bacterium]
MRFQRSQSKAMGDERILPLINIVFLLLIFFMIAGQLTVTDPFDIEPVYSASNGSDVRREALVVVDASGQVALDGEIVTEAVLVAVISERTEFAGADFIVRLKADGRAEATSIVAVMELLRDAGVEKLKLLTVPEPL